MSIYRRLQILNTEFNNRFSGFIIPGILYFTFSTCIFTYAMIIRFHQSIHFLYFLLFTIIPIVCTLGVILAFPKLSDVNMISLSFVAKFKAKSRSGYQLTLVRACGSLKVKFALFHKFSRGSTGIALGILVYTTFKLVAYLKT